MTRNTVIAAISNLSTAYNLVVINLVQVFVQNQYCGGDHCHDAVVVASTSCLVGAIVGQLCMGYVGDCLGRARALQLTMALSILGALTSAFVRPLDGSKPSSIFYSLAIARFFLGVGVGGVYPLSATIASESADSAKSRGRTASIVFSMQGVGNLVVPLIALVLVAIFGNPPNLDDKGPEDPGLTWRFALGIGALPGILLAPFKAAETSKRVPIRSSLQTTLVPGAGGSRGVDSAAVVVVPTDAPSQHQGAASSSSPEASSLDKADPSTASPRLTLWEALQQRAYWGKLIGCAGGWFLFDITFYGNQLFQARVLVLIFASNSTDAPIPIAGDVHSNRALQMLIIAAIGLPGYYVSCYLMDSWGRRIIQLQGFFFMGLTFGIMGLALQPLEHVPFLLMLLYGLTFFFSNFGPNATTFILPAETFPAHLRSTLNGFCAASGKLGATLGSACFVPLKRAVGLGNTMVACAVVSFLGLVVTFAFVEDRRGKDMEGDSNQLLGSSDNSNGNSHAAATLDQ